MLHFKNLFMEDKKIIPGGFQPGTVPSNKRIFTAEEELWLRENHNKVTKTVIAAKFGLNKTTIGRVFRRMGLKKTQEEIKAIMINKPRPSVESIEEQKFNRRKIEGGGRGGLKPNYHLTIWRKTNGDFSIKNILVYKTANYDDFNDLILIRKLNYDKFISVRTNKINSNLKKLELEKELIAKKEAKLAKQILKSKKLEERKLAKLKSDKKKESKNIKERKEKKERKEEENILKLKLLEEKNLIKLAQQEVIQKKRAEKFIALKKLEDEKAERIALKYQQGAHARKKREAAARQQAIFDSIKANTKPKSIMQANTELLDKDLVPVKLDAKTTVWVKRSKCVEVDGVWVKQTPLNVLLQTTDKFGRPIPFF